jgi:signal transduction histidine kinase/DNA-binding response OmpR family regulator
MAKVRLLSAAPSGAPRSSCAPVLREVGFDVVEVASAAEALRLAAEEPDLILLDASLPDLNGFEVARRLKADPRTASIPLLLVAGPEAAHASRARALEAGADGYLVQPVAAAELRAAVEGLLRVHRTEVELRRSEARFQSLATEARRREAERTASLAREQAARAEAEAGQDRLAFLAAASEILASSLEYQTTLARVARLAVPILADWCIVHLLEEDGALRALATAHADPAKADRASQLWQRYHPGLSDSHGPARVLHTGESELFPEIPDALLADVTRGARRFDALKRLGLTSYMCVPLQARDQTLGTMTFVTAESRRRYRTVDLALAQDLARRAAVAIDNARLYRDAQDAIQLERELTVQLRRLAEAYVAIGSAGRLDAIVRATTEQARAIIGAHHAVGVLLPEGTAAGGITAVSVSDRYANRRPERVEPEPRLMALVRDENRPIRLTAAELAAHPAWASAPPGPAGGLPPGGCLAAPLLGRDGRNVGVVQLSERMEGEFTEHDEAILVQLVQAASVAIDNLQLYRETEAASRAKDEFIATLSHELRTPLNAIVGWTQVLRSRLPATGSSGRALESIERNARLQAHLVDELLDVARIITGKLHVEIRPVDLGPVVEAAVDANRASAEARGVRLDVRPASGSTRVMGDPFRLQQVVSNLLSNAVKFTPAGGRVDVQVETREHHVEVRVRDTGRGIRPDFLPYVFERFRQAETRVAGESGLGLGLALVRRLVGLHGGSVRAESAGEGQGATFTVVLLLASTETSADTPRIPAQPAGTVPPVGVLVGMRVLVVDDDADTRGWLTAVLEDGGAAVTAVGSTQEALSALEQRPPHVLIADIAMPDEDGYALIRKVRAIPAERGGRVPALALTAYAGAEDRERIMSAGFEQHVPKPAQPAELIALIATLARQAGGGR